MKDYKTGRDVPMMTPEEKKVLGAMFVVMAGAAVVTAGIITLAGKDNLRQEMFAVQTSDAPSHRTAAVLLHNEL